MNSVVGRNDKSPKPNAASHHRHNGFVYSCQSYRHSAHFDATANKISTRGPLVRLKHHTQATIEERKAENFYFVIFEAGT
jgi:hypothetical protein